MSKIVIIRPPIIQPRHHVTSLRAVPSIGIAYINAALKKAGHEVIIIDAPGEALFNYRDIKDTPLTVNGLNASEILDRIPSDVEFIGISFMHANEYIYDRCISKTVRKAFPEATIIGGGENATGSTEKILKDAEAGVDYVVMGQGEAPFTDLIDCINKNTPISKVPNIAYLQQDSNRLIVTSRKTVLRGIDELPLPDWDGIPLEKYFKAKTGLSSHSERSMTMLATRGCPYACTFCTVPGMWGSKWKSRSPEMVVSEMLSYKNKYQVTHIDFVDLTFALNRKWVKEFCERLIDSKVKINWSLPIGTRTEGLDEEIIKLMKKAGCVRVLFSPESGSKETLLRINKKLKISDMNNAILWSVRHGLTVKLATIFGFPGQKKREVFDSFRFIFTAAIRGVHDVVCLNFVPYPGTQLYDELVERGDLDPSDIKVRLNNDLSEMTSYSSHIPTWSIKYISLIGMSLFYGTQFLVRPWRIYKSIRNIFFLKFPETNFEAILYCYFYRNVVDLNQSFGAEDLNIEKEKSSIPFSKKSYSVVGHGK